MKRFRALVFALGASCSACTPNAPPAPPPPSAAVRFLALGDSFTIGTGAAPERAFPARLVDRWRSDHAGCTLILENLAVNGYTTDDLMTLELPRVATFHPTFVTVAIGANDIVSGTSEAAYRANVRRIFETVKGSGARIVAVPQPDWSHSPAAAPFGSPDALAATIARFNAAFAEEARASGAEWVDLRALMRDQASAKQLASDGLHPSADAYDGWAAELARVLKSPCS